MWEHTHTHARVHTRHLLLHSGLVLSIGGEHLGRVGSEQAQQSSSSFCCGPFCVPAVTFRGPSSRQRLHSNISPDGAHSAHPNLSGWRGSLCLPLHPMAPWTTQDAPCVTQVCRGDVGYASSESLPLPAGSMQPVPTSTHGLPHSPLPVSPSERLWSTLTLFFLRALRVQVTLLCYCYGSRRGHS